MLSLFKNYTSSIIWQPADLYLATSPIHGLGVFSKNAVKKGSLIETAPLLIGSKEDYELLYQTNLHAYYFILADKKKPVAIGLGFASWYNHACPANAAYSIDKKKMIMNIKAMVPIKPGEEITINYHGTFDNNLPIEF